MQDYYDLFIQNGFELTKETAKAAEFTSLGHKEVVYLLLDRKDMTMVLHPKTVEASKSLQRKCEEKKSHSTALTQFPKEIHNGQNPIQYGYALKLTTVGELDAFLAGFNCRDHL
ncbi:hypothetical protein [Metabacillus iocasae]|uniref:Uncharacterized protein n=1 Tax=Priestia iocasae TaxID=2291674 RepID=A0ABS2QY47_9BACI|nr:hypothetical protein [Metabacillus iocasae]MBM7704411.1 hypothetical protein [Metabacillus iocasae]